MTWCIETSMIFYSCRNVYFLSEIFVDWDSASWVSAGREKRALIDIDTVRHCLTQSLSNLISHHLLALISTHLNSSGLISTHLNSYNLTSSPDKRLQERRDSCCWVVASSGCCWLRCPQFQLPSWTAERRAAAAPTDSVVLQPWEDSQLSPRTRPGRLICGTPSLSSGKFSSPLPSASLPYF